MRSCILLCTLYTRGLKHAYRRLYEDWRFIPCGLHTLLIQITDCVPAQHRRFFIYKIKYIFDHRPYAVREVYDDLWMVTYNLGQQTDGVRLSFKFFFFEARNTLNGVLYCKYGIDPVYCLKWRATCSYLEDCSFIRVRYEFKTPGIHKALGGILFVRLQRGRIPSQGLYYLSYFLLPYKYPFLISRTYRVALIRSRFSLSI